MQADVKEIFDLPNVASQLFILQSETHSACQEACNEAEKLLNETQNEEKNSLQMLNFAREVEETAHVAMRAAETVMLAAEARLAAAIVEEAAAIASENPVAIASSAAEVWTAQQNYQQAREAYEIARKTYEAAKAHRELLEKRYNMAKQAVNLAEVMKTKLGASCMKCLTQIVPIVETGSSRIMQAHEDLQQYHAHNTSVANLSVAQIQNRSLRNSTQKTSDDYSEQKISSNYSAFKHWENYQPTLGEPVKPQEINARLNPSKDVFQGLLENRYQCDQNFRAQVDSYREQAKTDRAEVEKKIKKNMVGNFAEEIVKNALKPYGDFYRTQEHVSLPDGSYTKPDFILHDLKVPLILGKGKGMGIRENGSIGIEVKAGQSNYIWSQREHLKTQAQGHIQCDASWTICTRDVNDIEFNKQQELRNDIREAGSPIIGFLPRKEELDSVCINFVFGDIKHD